MAFNMWILSLFPMLFLLHITFRGVYYVGDKKRDELLRKAQLIKDRNSEGHSDGCLSMDDADDKKPLISEA